MKKIVILVVLVMFTISSHGRSNSNSMFKFGVSGGLNFSYVSHKTLEFEDYNVETLRDNYTGFHIGAMTHISVLGLFIQPELLYSSIGNEMRVTEDGENPKFYSRKISRLDLPVLVGMTFGPARFGVGPVGSVMLRETSDFDKITEGKGREEFNNMTFGYQVGIGVNISNLLIDIKYEGSLSKLGDGVTIGDETKKFDSRPRQIIISLGVLL